MTPTRRLDLRKARILAVDDNAHSLNLLMQVLVGYRAQDIRACASAREASAVVGKQPFDLVIVDGEMPDEDGFQFTRDLRSSSYPQNVTTPVILVSSNTPLEKIMRARDAGANLVVKKPISPAILLSRIEWLARNGRDFVEADTYRGPDRRFRRGVPPEGLAERRADAIQLTASPDRALSQDDIDSLFG